MVANPYFPNLLLRGDSFFTRFHTARVAALANTVPLMPPAYVKPYVKRQKNDAAICEAVTRAKMRSVEKGPTAVKPRAMRQLTTRTPLGSSLASKARSKTGA